MTDFLFVPEPEPVPADAPVLDPDPVWPRLAPVPYPTEEGSLAVVWAPSLVLPTLDRPVDYAHGVKLNITGALLACIKTRAY